MANPYVSADVDLDPFAEPGSGPTPPPPRSAAAPPSLAVGPTASVPPPRRSPGAVQSNPTSPASVQGSPSAASAPAKMEFYEPSAAESAPGAQQPFSPPHTAAGPPRPASAPPGREGATGSPSPPAARDLQTSRFWTLEFYQQFFNVDTNDVLMRMGNALVPVHPPDFLISRNWHFNDTAPPPEQQQQHSADVEAGGVPSVPGEKVPDMYGPFWICTTLWMTLAVVGNIISKISHSHAVQNAKASAAVAQGTPAPVERWHYDFTQASVACFTIYVYCFGMAALLWGLMKWKAIPVSLLDTLCLYGYSMTTFLLAAILCVIPSHALQWLVCLGCGVWSTTFLLMNFWHVWKLGLEASWFCGVVLVVSAFHLAITLSFKFYFFNYDF